MGLLYCKVKPEHPGKTHGDYLTEEHEGFLHIIQSYLSKVSCPMTQPTFKFAFLMLTVSVKLSVVLLW